MLGISMSNIYTIIIMLCQFTAGLLIYLIANKWDLPYGIMQIIYQIISFTVPTLIYKTLTRQKFSSFMAFRRIAKRNLLYIAVISFSAQPGVMLISAVSSLFFTNTTQEFMANVSADYPFLVSIFILAVVPAFFEEISMRGVISQCLENISMPLAATLSGLYFALIHLNPQQFAYAFILGGILWILYNSTKSILAPMLAHFIINFTQILLSNLGLWEDFLVPAAQKDITKFMVFSIIFVIFSTIIFFKALQGFINENPVCETNQEKIPVIKIISPSLIALLVIYIFFAIG